MIDSTEMFTGCAIINYFISKSNQGNYIDCVDDTDDNSHVKLFMFDISNAACVCTIGIKQWPLCIALTVTHYTQPFKTHTRQVEHNCRIITYRKVTFVARIFFSTISTQKNTK